MSQEEKENTPLYKVIKNHQEEFAIWLAHRKPPFSWQDAHKSGTKEECLAYITKRSISDYNRFAFHSANMDTPTVPSALRMIPP